MANFKTASKYFNIFGLFGAVFIFLFYDVYGQFKLPSNYYDYSVFINIDNKYTGTGFYIDTPSGTYLITARHVLFKNNSNEPLGNFCVLTTHKKNTNNYDKKELEINLSEAAKSKFLIEDSYSDVAIVRIGASIPGEISSGKYDKYVHQLIKGKLEIEGFPYRGIRKLSQVTPADEVYIIGYPTSLGVFKQFDITKPLVRKGIVAGIYEKNNTIILDVPIYPGNSGGPIICSYVDKDNIYLGLLGIVVQLIPFEDEQRKINLSVSGYSVGVSMDKVLELIQNIETKIQ